MGCGPLLFMPNRDSGSERIAGSCTPSVGWSGGECAGVASGVLSGDGDACLEMAGELGTVLAAELAALNDVSGSSVRPRS